MIHSVQGLGSDVPAIVAAGARASLSLGYLTIPREPCPVEMQTARDRVLAACRKNGIAFQQGCTADNVIARIDEGVRVIAGHSEASAIKGRAHQKRKLPV
jgi:hypothetical protein